MRQGYGRHGSWLRCRSGWHERSSVKIFSAVWATTWKEPLTAAITYTGSSYKLPNILKKAGRSRF
jgi:hypothetical protein